MESAFYAVIPAGGAGTRLWPLSRAAYPKFLTDLTGSGKSMLQETAARLRPVADGGMIVVTGAAHAARVRAQLPGLGQNSVIAEPEGRDSMAAIGLAAAVLHRRHGNVVMGSFAADHVIRDESAFRSALRTAVSTARSGYLVTLGIKPTRAATGFGYIRCGAQILPEPGADFGAVFAARSFLEKPDAPTARSYFASGEYYWNAGMFVVLTGVLLDALRELEPRLYADLNEIAAAWDTARRGEVQARIWPDLKKIAIDYALAEPLAARGRVAVVPADMGWSDVGDYMSLRDVSGRAGESRVSPGGTEQVSIVRDSSSAFVSVYGKPIVVLGVDDAVVVETKDVIFVSTAKAAQNIKELVDDLPPDLK